MNIRSLFLFPAVGLVWAFFFAGCATTPPHSSDFPPEARQALAEANRDFTLEGQPIHPALVHYFEAWLTDDGPIIVAVDVREGQSSREFSTPVFRNGNEFHSEVPDTDPPEHAGYQRIGRLADGTHVLRTFCNTGGSANFEHLLLFRFHLEIYHRPEGKADWRLVLREVGDIDLGDRDEGQIIVEANDVKVEPSVERTAEIIVTPDEASE